jgi:4-hydroxy-3-methylbut-2-enyl diphosphate reductase
MGPRRATEATNRLVLAEHSPHPMVLLGVAGGLSSGDRPGDVIVATSLLGGDGSEEIDLSEAFGVLALLKRENIEAREGKIISVEAIVHGEARRRELAARGALAVDMESFWCAPLVRYHPFVVIRVLLDVPGKELRSPAVFGATREAYRSLKAVARTLATWSPVSVSGYPLPEVGEG